LLTFEEKKLVNHLVSGIPACEKGERFIDIRISSEYRIPLRPSQFTTNELSAGTGSKRFHFKLSNVSF
jgi:hypothetical protein